MTERYPASAAGDSTDETSVDVADAPAHGESGESGEAADVAGPESSMESQAAIEANGHDVTSAETAGPADADQSGQSGESTASVPVQAGAAAAEDVQAEHRPAVTTASSPGLRSRQPRRPAAPVAVRPVRAPLSGLRQKIESTAALRESLDAKEAEAQDLRASIEQLRQELDTERRTGVAPAAATGAAAAAGAAKAAPAVKTKDTFGGIGSETEGGSGGTTTRDPFAPEEPARRRSWWPMVLGAVLLAVVLLFVASRIGNDASPAGSPTDPVAGSTGGSGATDAPNAGQNPAAGAKPSPMAWPGAGQVLVPPGMPTTGPGLDAPGTHLQVALDEDGTSLDVYESLILAGPKADELELVVPSLPAQVLPMVTNLQVQLGDAVAKVAGNSTDGFSVTPAEGSTYTKAVLRYKLTSAVIRLTPAKANRVSVLALPLTASYSQTGGVPVNLRTSDKQVIAIDCPAATSLADRICSKPEGTAWTATLPASSQRPVFYLLADRTR